ncbi:hypothetical protein [Atlantibacter hermannii]|uniref:hypothetical protein n=1 Tax=Atlantibacter hermannii TaxID=565 RepID=UPI00289E9431|nr:hypothetical protein [Atlantibacter hermannii]
MNKLTVSRCRLRINELRFTENNHGLTNQGYDYLEALEIALPVLEQQEKGKSQWIEWRGNSQPVNPSVIVKVRWADGDTDSGPCRHFFWGRNCGNPIVAYRVVEQERERGEEE